MTINEVRAQAPTLANQFHVSHDLVINAPQSPKDLQTQI